jgi:hypothetical protein
MEADEEGTLARLKNPRPDRTDSRTAFNGGRTVTTACDRMLIEFASAFAAAPIAAG